MADEESEDSIWLQNNAVSSESARRLQLRYRVEHDQSGRRNTAQETSREVILQTQHFLPTNRDAYTDPE